MNTFLWHEREDKEVEKLIAYLSGRVNKLRVLAFLAGLFDLQKRIIKNQKSSAWEEKRTMFMRK